MKYFSYCRKGTVSLVYASFLAFFLLFISTGETAFSTTEEKEETVREAAVLPLRSDFWYQVHRHYDELITQVQAVSEEEFKVLMSSILETLEDNKDYFKSYQQSLFDVLKNHMISWLQSGDGPLSREVFYSASNSSSIYDEDKSEDSNRERNYDASDEEEEEGSGGEDQGASSPRSTPSFLDDSGGEFSESEDGYSKWQLERLESLFDISVGSLDDLNPDIINEGMIEKFVTNYVEGGYSWLINDIVQGMIGAPEGFSWEFSKVIEAPEDLISSIFEALWLDFNWEYFDIKSPTYIADTYYKTLSDFLNDPSKAEDSRERIVKSLYQYFFHNREDFGKTFLEGTFQTIKEEYERHVERKNWKEALITWSVYSAYQKIFSPTNTVLKRARREDESAFTSVSKLNKKETLLKSLEDARSRAIKTYTKVYPHPKTETVVYGSKTPTKVATLELGRILSNLKAIGLKVEEDRPAKENIFVPSLFFIVSTKPHIKGGDHGRQFIDISLDFSGLPPVPLTRNPKCKVFEEGTTTEDFYKMAMQDVVNGRVMMGKDRESEEAAAQELLSKRGLKDIWLPHSERVFIHLLRNPGIVEQIASKIKEKLWEKDPTASGAYKIYGAASLAYSTRTVCPYCTPSLIVLQNSYEEGFLKLLFESLNTDEGSITFFTRGFKKENERGFRLDTFVTAAVDFDEEGRDLAEEGDHSYGGPPKDTHNPHAKLFFRDDVIDIHRPVPTDLTSNNFFYEFVGETIHSRGEISLPYKSAVFSSGSTLIKSTPWKSKNLEAFYKGTFTDGGAGVAVTAGAGVGAAGLP